jgi:hypothetical protein
MSRFHVARIAEDRPSQEKWLCLNSKFRRVAGTVVVAAVVLALGVVSVPSSLVRAADGPQADATDKGGVASAPSSFVAETRKTLKTLQGEIAVLGTQALGRPGAANRPEDDAVNQRITIESAKANYQNAQLTREVAEITILEYEEGIFKQDQATVEGELKRAESELSGAPEAIQLAKEKLALIKQLSKGSAEDLANEFRFEDDVVAAELREPKARLAVEQAKSRLKFLREYTRPKVVKELKSEVEKARSDELAKHARWELEKLKLKKLEAAIKSQEPTIPERRVLTLLTRALPIAEQLSARLDQVKKDVEPGDSLRMELTDLTNQLQALVDQAQNEQAAAMWAKLKPKVHRAATLYLGAPQK